MLVIRRRPGESLVLGNQITLTVLQMKGGFVKLGIDAPPEVSVTRGEIAAKVEEANRAAAELTPDPSIARRLGRTAGKGGRGEGQDE